MMAYEPMVLITGAGLLCQLEVFSRILLMFHFSNCLLPGMLRMVLILDFFKLSKSPFDLSILTSGTSEIVSGISTDILVKN